VIENGCAQQLMAEFFSSIFCRIVMILAILFALIPASLYFLSEIPIYLNKKTLLFAGILLAKALRESIFMR